MVAWSGLYRGGEGGDADGVVDRGVGGAGGDGPARAEALEAEIVELTARLEGEREAWSRLRITRETVADVIMDLGEPGTTAPVPGGPEPEGVMEPGVRVEGAIMVPHWREGPAGGCTAGCLPGHR